jgi:phosphatidylethanolamine N-methyltransferase
MTLPDGSRATDAMLVLVILYGVAFAILPNSFRSSLALQFVHALLWCIVHYFGLGLLLRAQSDNKFLVRHYLKNYYYDYAQNDGGHSAIIEAFSNWKAIYNLSMCMTYGTFTLTCSATNPYIHLQNSVSCIGVAWKAYSLPHDWTVGNELLRHTLGAVRTYFFHVNVKILLIGWVDPYRVARLGYNGVI